MSRATFNLGPFLEKEKLKTDGTNFMTWFRTLRILLAPHKMGYVLEAAVGNHPTDKAPRLRKMFIRLSLMIPPSCKAACSMPWRLICRSAMRT